MCDNIYKFLFVVFINISHFDGNQMRCQPGGKETNEIKDKFLFLLFQPWGSAKLLNIHGLMTKLFSYESNLQVL